MQEGKKMTFNDDTYSSVAANNSHHITKQKLLKIREIYEFCKNAQQNLQVRHIVNAKFAQIVEEAEEQIKLFAEGKLNIDNDALDLMKEYIEERAIAIANYIIDHNATVRQTARRFGISKSTVHKDVTDRLEHINPSLAAQARVVLDINKSERHIRGGLATKEKYLHQHEKNKS